MNLEWNKVPQQEYEQHFPIGAIIEDHKGIYKILGFEKQQKTHKYKVEVLKQKEPIPDHLKSFIDEKIQYMIVLPQNIANIKRIE